MTCKAKELNSRLRKQTSWLDVMSAQNDSKDTHKQRTQQRGQHIIRRKPPSDSFHFPHQQPLFTIVYLKTTIKNRSNNGKQDGNDNDDNDDKETGATTSITNANVVGCAIIDRHIGICRCSFFCVYFANICYNIINNNSYYTNGSDKDNSNGYITKHATNFSDYYFLYECKCECECECEYKYEYPRW